MSKYLIVAYQTSGGHPLRAKTTELGGHDPDAEFVLLVPATRTQNLFTWTEGEATAVARKTGLSAARELREAGVRLNDVRVGDPDPFLAVTNELASHPDYDTIIVSTFPHGISRWLHLDLPTRLAQRFDLPIVHVVADPSEVSPEG